MLNAVDDLLPIKLIPDPVDSRNKIIPFTVKYRSHPLLLELALELGEHRLDGVGIGRVDRSVDILKAELVHPLDGGIGVVHPEVVEHEADVVEEMPRPQLVEPHLELLDIDGLLEGHHQVDAPLLGDACEHCNAAPRVLLVVNLQLDVLARPLVGWNGALGDHGLVEVHNAEASRNHDPQLLCHELGLTPDPPLQGIIYELGDSNLLLPYMLGLVDGSVLGGADLLLGVPAQELSSPLFDGHADLHLDGLCTGDPFNVLLVELSGLFLLPPKLPYFLPRVLE